MSGFTVCGWVNSVDLRIGSGGNRIAFALAEPDGPGFDLVQMDDGSLQLGVNQWPDDTPARSSGGMITEDPQAGADNWVFFAVTYDGSNSAGNVNFYFGGPDQDATLDSTLDYDQRPIEQSGALTLGNFGSVVGARTTTGPTGSRVFRGLMDEINIFTEVLTLAEIQELQTAPAQEPDNGEQPRLSVLREDDELILEWDATTEFQLQASGGIVTSWNDLSVTPQIDGDHRTVRLPLDQLQQFFRLRDN